MLSQVYKPVEYSANIISITLLSITCTAEEDDDEILMLHPWEDREDDVCKGTWQENYYQE